MNAEISQALDRHEESMRASGLLSPADIAIVMTNLRKLAAKDPDGALRSMRGFRAEAAENALPLRVLAQLARINASDSMIAAVRKGYWKAPQEWEAVLRTSKRQPLAHSYRPVAADFGRR